MTMGWNAGLDDGWRQYDSTANNCIFYNSLSKMNELGVNTDANWNDIDKNMISKIRTNIKERNTVNLVDDIRVCLFELELKYGVEE